MWWKRVYFNVKKSFIQHDAEDEKLRKENEKVETRNKKLEMRNEKIEMTIRIDNFKKMTLLKKNQKVLIGFIKISLNKF